MHYVKEGLHMHNLRKERKKATREAEGILTRTYLNCQSLCRESSNKDGMNQNLMMFVLHRWPNVWRWNVSLVLADFYILDRTICRVVHHGIGVALYCTEVSPHGDIPMLTVLQTSERACIHASARRKVHHCAGE